MSIEKCPGAKAFTRPTPEFISCPACHQEVEIWTDELEVKCAGCGTLVSRDMLQGCVDYCESAQACLGESLYRRLMAAKERSKDLQDSQKRTA